MLLLNFSLMLTVGSQCLRGNVMQERVWDGFPVHENGIYQNVPIGRYHNDPKLFTLPSVSKSIMKLLFKQHGGSPKKFWGHWKQNPKSKPIQSTKPLEFGKAAHALLLGDVTGEEFLQNFELRPEEFKNYTTKAARDWREGVLESGRSPVTPDDLEMIVDMSEELGRNPEVAQLNMLDGRTERTMVAIHEPTGLMLRTRPDVTIRDGLYSDLKTTASLEEGFLRRQIKDTGIYLQAGKIRLMCEILGIPFEAFVLVFVLKDDICDSAVLRLEDNDIEQGYELALEGLFLIRSCLENNHWPGAEPFNAGGTCVGMNDWASRQIDTEIKTLRALRVGSPLGVAANDTAKLEGIA